MNRYDWRYGTVTSRAGTRGVPSRPVVKEPSFLPTSTKAGKDGRIENGKHTLPELSTVLKDIPA